MCALDVATSPPAVVSAEVVHSPYLRPPTILPCCGSPCQVLNIKYRIIRMFANDICYYKQVFSGEDLISVQSDVMLFSNWLSSKHLKLDNNNNKKCWSS